MIRINLFPIVETEEKTPPQLYGVLAFALGLLLLGGWYWSLRADKTDLEAQAIVLEQEAERLRQVTAQVQEFEQRKEALESRIAVIARLKANQQGPVQLMNDIIASVPANPRGLWLTSLAQQQNTITIEGRAFDVPFIADFIAALDGSPRFKNVELRFWEQDSETSIRFQLFCELQDKET